MFTISMVIIRPLSSIIKITQIKGVALSYFNQSIENVFLPKKEKIKRVIAC